MLFFFYDIGFGFAYGLLERSSYIGLFGYYLGDVDYIERVEVIQCLYVEGEGIVYVVKEKGGNFFKIVL